MRRAAGGTDEEAARQGWGGPAVDYRGASVGGAGGASRWALCRPTPCERLLGRCSMDGG
jgi:hypothetical protein